MIFESEIGYLPNLPISKFFSFWVNFGKTVKESSREMEQKYQNTTRSGEKNQCFGDT